jgi:hypothetical protein
VADEARTGLRPAVAVVVADDPLAELPRAAWRMAPIGTAVLTGPAGTPGFGSHFQERTEPAASPTGFPFKVAALPGTVADRTTYDARERTCDLGYLRTAFERPDGSVGYRCPAEPVDVFVRKGGAIEETEGRTCLCNALTATIGLGQRRKDGTDEPPLLTLGADSAVVSALLARHPDGWTAADVLAYLTPPPA